MPTTPDALRGGFGNTGRARIVIEAGTHSLWISRLLMDCGHEVIVANARQVRLIYRSFARQMREAIPEAVQDALAPVLTTIESISREIHVFDKRVEELAKAEYPETSLLRTVPGVGAFTALCRFVCARRSAFRQRR